MRSNQNQSPSQRASLQPSERLLRKEVERVDAELIEQELLAFESELDGMDGWLEDEASEPELEAGLLEARRLEAGITEWRLPGIGSVQGALGSLPQQRMRAAPQASPRPKLQPTIIPARAQPIANQRPLSS